MNNPPKKIKPAVAAAGSTETPCQEPCLFYFNIIDGQVQWIFNPYRSDHNLSQGVILRGYYA